MSGQEGDHQGGVGGLFTDKQRGIAQNTEKALCPEGISKYLRLPRISVTSFMTYRLVELHITLDITMFKSLISQMSLER